MSEEIGQEQLSSGEQTVAERFGDYVRDHNKRAVRWEVVGMGQQAIKFAEFKISGQDGHVAPAAPLPTDMYFLNLWLTLSRDEQKQTQLTSAHVNIMRHPNGEIGVMEDVPGKLEELVGIKDPIHNPAQATAALLDKLQGLEGEDQAHFIPAGERDLTQ